jgi:hypothetical protein
MPSAAAPPPNVLGTPTDLTSDAERMISYRHQEHLWQTADGAHHLVLNRGSLAPAPGLSLYSSYDGGSSWLLQQTFAATDDQSTGDGQLAGDDLSVVYRTSAGAIAFAQLHYDASSRTWTPMLSETVFASTQAEGLNPALATDSRGTVWCAFAAHNFATNAWNLRLISRAGGGNVWVDTGLVFGPTERSSERSARPVAIPGGMGMMYTSKGTFYWAMRSDALPDNSPWDVGMVYVGGSSFQRDPYSSHFSVVVDDQGNAHAAIADAVYLRRSFTGGTWSAPKDLNQGKNTPYLQIALANGKVAVGWSAARTKGSVVVSADGGYTFAPVAYLVLPPDAPGVKWGNARTEMPTRSTGPVAPLLQQYEDNAVQRLLLFRVPTP